MDWLVANKEWVFGGVGVPISIFIITLFWNYIKKRVKSERKNLNKINKEINILFIDDKSFKVVDILKAAGWQNTSRIQDVDSMDDKIIREADIFFIDIQGVGKKLKFKEEGLGLVEAIKKKYPNSRVIVYSSESTGNIFHQALRIADDSLSKDADPYQFIQLVENYSKEIKIK